MTRRASLPLLPDEIFSSWLVRYALAHGCDPLSLTGSFWRGERPWTRDLDRGVPDDKLVELSRRSCVTVQAMRGACLDAYAPRSPDSARLAIWHWVIPIGARNRLRHGGLQFCPQCLNVDRSPYFRIAWRLAWVTRCDVHDVLLLDRCTNCRVPIEPHRLTAMDRTIAVCSTCKASLAAQHAPPAPVDSFAFQNLARDVHAAGHGYFGSLQLGRDDWFALARHLAVLLRRASTAKPTWSLNRLVHALGFSHPADYRSSTGLALELLSTQDRSVLLAGVAQVISAGIDQFVSAVHAAGTTTRTLSTRRGQLQPAVLLRIMETQDSEARSHRQPQRHGDLMPRPSASVRQSWMRLQRRCAAESR